MTVCTGKTGKFKAEIFSYQCNLDFEVEQLCPGCTMSWADVSAERGANGTGLCLLQNLCTTFHYVVITCHEPLVLWILWSLLETTLSRLSLLLFSPAFTVCIILISFLTLQLSALLKFIILAISACSPPQLPVKSEGLFQLFYMIKN